jgi:branched-subunit amino acid transport protein
MIDILKTLFVLFGYLIIGPLGGYFISQDRRLQDFVCILFIFTLGLHIDNTVLMVDSIEWYRGVTKGYEFSIMEVLAISLIFASVFDPKKKFIFLPMGTIPWFIYIVLSSVSVFSAIEVSYVFMNILKFTKIWIIVYAIANYVRGRNEVQTIITGLCIMILYQFFWGEIWSSQQGGKLKGNLGHSNSPGLPPKFFKIP